MKLEKYEITEAGKAIVEDGMNVAEKTMLAFVWIDDRKNQGQGIGLRLAEYLDVAQSTAYKYLRAYLRVKRALRA